MFLAVFDFRCYSMDVNKTARKLARMIDDDLWSPETSGRALMRNILFFSGLMHHVSRMAQKNSTYYKYLCRDFHNDLDPEFVKLDYKFDEDRMKKTYKWDKLDIQDLQYIIDDASEKWKWVLFYASTKFRGEY